ncbi:MAG: hypothetical protein ACRDIU_00160 [Actinomycetota bacterium]
MSGKFRAIRGFVVATALALAAASAAWACTAQTYINQLSHNMGPERSRVTVSGNSVSLSPVSVGEAQPKLQIRWDSVNGPAVDLATTVTGEKFESVVAIPQAAPGVHYLIVTLGDRKLASAPFQVTSGGGRASASSADLWNGFSKTTGGTGADVPPSTGAPGNGLGAGLALLAVGGAGITLGLIATAKAKAHKRG